MKSVLIDSRATRALKDKLGRLGYRVIELPPSRHLPVGISAHPDSLLFRLENEIVTFADYCDEAAYVFSDIREAHPAMRISFCDEAPSHAYPNDAKYNALTLGKRIFARVDSLAPTVKELAQARGYELVCVKQGYPACTTLALDSTHAITADNGLASVLTSHGVEVTKIEVGSIALPPYEYGFIGGAAGVDGDKVYFAGDYTTHPSASLIRAAVESVGLTPVSLTDGLLTDIGGLVFLD